MLLVRHGTSYIMSCTLYARVGTLKLVVRTRCTLYILQVSTLYIEVSRTLRYIPGVRYTSKSYYCVIGRYVINISWYIVHYELYIVRTSWYVEV